MSVKTLSQSFQRPLPAPAGRLKTPYHNREEEEDSKLRYILFLPGSAKHLVLAVWSALMPPLCDTVPNATKNQATSPTDQKLLGWLVVNDMSTG